VARLCLRQAFGAALKMLLPKSCYNLVENVTLVVDMKYLFGPGL